MTQSEILEEIRTRLGEAQTASVERPWAYADADFVAPLRSALRHLRQFGLTTTAVIETDGTFTTDPDEREGLLLALRVVASLLRGDLLRKLREGELGLVFRAGTDLIDTKTATRSFETAAVDVEGEFTALFAIAMAAADGGANVYGEQTTIADGGVAT